jgi:putative ABC transport system permease protein
VAGIAVGVAAAAGLAAALWPAPGPADPSAATRITVLPHGSVSTLTMADAGALADPSVVPDATAVAPIVERAETVSVGGQQLSATMTGSTAGWLAVTGHGIARGRIFTASEVTSGAHVVVLGASVAQRLFPGSTATGESVTVAGRGFSVIGVLAASATGGDSVALMPVTSAQGITGTAGGRTVDRILVSAPSKDAVYTAYQEVNDLLLQTHHTANPFSADFTVTAATVAAGHGALLLGGLGLLAAVAPPLGAMAILRLRRIA